MGVNNVRIFKAIVDYMPTASNKSRHMHVGTGICTWVKVGTGICTWVLVYARGYWYLHVGTGICTWVLLVWAEC